MSGNTISTLLVLPRAVLKFLGLSAIIVGILAMHVWMEGHGPSAHGSSAHGGAISVSSTTPESSIPSLDPHAETNSSAHFTVSNGDAGNGESGHGCVGSCGNDGAALGMCLLAVIVVAVLAFLIRSGQCAPGSVLMRGPPLIRLRPLLIFVPSLIHLCISRT